jgi:hypothetical protein
MADAMTPERRMAHLEARVERLEKALRVARRTPDKLAAAAATEGFEVDMARSKALGELRHGEYREELRRDPEQLAWLREENAKENAFLAERGLPPIPFEWDDL